MKLKKLLTLAVAVMTVFTLSTTALAVENYNGVSPNEPGSITINSTDIPTGVWNIFNEGRYDFNGTSDIRKLYTDCRFTGKSSYTVSVTNNGENDLTVMVKTEFQTFSTNTLASGTTSQYSVSGMNEDTTFYILFKGAYQNFSGYIE